MLLTSLEIENFRSLEHVKLEDIGLVNILIGRNNSGKSSVFKALQTLRDRLSGNSINITTLLTNCELSRSWHMSLEFTFFPLERERLLSQLKSAFSHNEELFVTIKNSPLLSRFRLHYEFRGQETQVDFAKLKKLEIVDEKNNWEPVWLAKEDSIQVQIVDIFGYIKAFPGQPITDILNKDNAQTFTKTASFSRGNLESLGLSTSNQSISNDHPSISVNWVNA